MNSHSVCKISNVSTDTPSVAKLVNLTSSKSFLTKLAASYASFVKDDVSLLLYGLADIITIRDIYLGRF